MAIAFIVHTGNAKSMAGNKRKWTELTTGTKKRLCTRFKERPSTHQELVEWAKKELSLDISRSTVSTVLKDSEKWLDVPTDESSIVRARPPKHASLEKALVTWFNDVRARGAIVNDAMLIEKGKVFGSLLGRFSVFSQSHARLDLL